MEETNNNLSFGVSSSPEPPRAKDADDKPSARPRGSKTAFAQQEPRRLFNNPRIRIAALQHQIAGLRRNLSNMSAELEAERVLRRSLQADLSNLRYRLVDALYVFSRWQGLARSFARIRRLLFPRSNESGSTIDGTGKPIVEEPAEAIAAAASANSTDSTIYVEEANNFGVNVIGYMCSEKGVGEAARASVRSLEAAGVSYAVANLTDLNSSNVETTDANISSGNPHEINLVHLNADEVEPFIARQDADFSGRYNIGYWNWELSTFPGTWKHSFSYFQEIWVPSSFCLDAISRASAIPVVRIPYAINPQAPINNDCTRSRFGLSPTTCVFLFLFDFQSVMERKNPLGLIEAFRRAFPGRDCKDDVTLFIKCARGQMDESKMRLLREACDSAKVILYDEVMPRETLNSLLSTCHAYVSLHRSEGYGLTLAEAMSMGKPVIATAYSGNMDFMTPSNSFLVKYRLVEIAEDFGPYAKGGVWADPDLDHAAALMRYVYTHRGEAANIGALGKSDVEAALNPRVVGRLIRARLGK